MNSSSSGDVEAVDFLLAHGADSWMRIWIGGETSTGTDRPIDLARGQCKQRGGYHASRCHGGAGEQGLATYAGASAVRLWLVLYTCFYWCPAFYNV